MINGIKLVVATWQSKAIYIYFLNFNTFLSPELQYPKFARCEIMLHYTLALKMNCVATFSALSVMQP